MKPCYLRLGDDALDEAKKYRSVRAACEEFRDVATRLQRFGQRLEASVHVADHLSEVGEYPDYVLSIGPNGGLVKETT